MKHWEWARVWEHLHLIWMLTKLLSRSAIRCVGVRQPLSPGITLLVQKANEQSNLDGGSRECIDSTTCPIARQSQFIC